MCSNYINFRNKIILDGAIIISRLFTKEDEYHVHKILGGLVLLNMFYQFIIYFIYKEMNLRWYLMLPHIVLHISSFKFNVLSKRPSRMRGNMFIWKELRLHSAIFAYRGCAVIFYPKMGPYVIFATMAAADLATYVYGDPNVSTVRGHHIYQKKSLVKRLAGAFFSISQLGGTLICSGAFQPHGVSPILAFSTLPSIQTSAFGMTLLRKNIISKTTWQIVYSFELVLAYYVWYCEYNNIWLLPISVFAFFLRSQGLSKYIIWMSLLLVNARISFF